MENDDNKIIDLFSGTLWEAQLITSLLKNEGIESFLKNSVLSSYAYNPSFSQEIKIMILESDLDNAQKIILRFFNKMT